MTVLIDTHAHIGFDSYDDDRDEMMSRAFEMGVKKILHPCCSIEEIPKLIEFTKRFTGDGMPNLYTAIGMHPIYIEADFEESLIDKLEENLTKDKVRAVGECGLDYFHTKDEDLQAKQRRFFQLQIDLAKKYNLPIIVHTRDAWEDTLRILEENYPENKDAKSGVIHCYTGGEEFAKACIARGFYISWSGILTFKKNDNFREVAKTLDIERVLVETDSPYLAPQKVRGKRNEPSYVNYVAEVLAECYDISKEELAKITTKNAETLFNF